MAEERKAFKDYFNLQYADEMGANLRAAYSRFNVDAYRSVLVDELESLEFRDRQLLLAQALRAGLPTRYSRALDVLVATLGEKLGESAKVMDEGFHYWPYGTFIEIFGVGEPASHSQSMAAIYELTQRFTGEFAIRPFLAADANAVLPHLTEWVHDENSHVRRLVSEGSRPRLPWGRKLTVFAPNHREPLKLLGHLKRDRSEYVRKSVANHLNDISKENPSAVLNVCAKWWASNNEQSRAIVQHALRGLVKAGDERALALLGYAPADDLRVVRFDISPKRLKLGILNSDASPRPTACRLMAELANAGRTACPVLLDYRVISPGRSGRDTQKVW
ncbi:MAG: hypothetical protein AAF493_27590, partial [Pseudomonadota bacterium]